MKDVILTIMFVGDIMLARNIGNKIIQQGVEFLAKPLNRLLEGADIICGNLESPIADSSRQPGAFKAPLESVEVLRYFHLLNLANNHIFDCGEEGLSKTIYILKSRGIRYVGIGKTAEDAYTPVLINKKGFKVAFFGCVTCEIYKNLPFRNSSTYQLAILEDKKLKQSIENIRSLADLIVLIVHGGKEHIAFPPPALVHFLRETLFGDDVDIIVTHHPHVLGGYEFYELESGFKLIWYSLGDFIFDSRCERRRRTGILKLKIRKEESKGARGSFELVPLYIDLHYIPRPVSKQVEKGIIREIEKVSRAICKRNYTQIYSTLYFQDYLHFAVDRLSSIYKYEGIKGLFNFVLRHLRIKLRQPLCL